MEQQGDDFSRDDTTARKNSHYSTSTNLKSKVSVTPIKSGGASFKTNVLIQESISKLIYKPSTGAALFSFIFLAVGLSILFFSISPIFNKTSEGLSINLFLLLFGFVFAGAGGLMFYYFYKPRVFDKQLGLYYKAYSVKSSKSNKKKIDNGIPLNKIIAIQIIGEHINRDNGSYKSFEFNLVLDDNSRKNIIDHGNLKSIIDDAHILSDFLGVPIWHAASHKA